jgi:hypothetical protein
MVPRTWVALILLEFLEAAEVLLLRVLVRRQAE